MTLTAYTQNSKNHAQINPKKVIITGASNGIGFALAEELAKQGSIVYATARNPNNDMLQKLHKRYPNNIIIKQLDVTDSDENIKKIIQEIGIVDVLINNAGAGLLGPVYCTTDIQRKTLFNTNFFGPINVTNAVVDEMLKRPDRKGMLLFVSSIVGPFPDDKQVIYSASKGAGEHIASGYLSDFKKNNIPIKVACINPGPVLTQFPASAVRGNRFTPEENPLIETEADYQVWKEMMAKNGRPVSETVETTLRVMNTENPDFWNPTHPDVYDAFNRTYRDPSGNQFAAGPGLKAQNNTPKAKL